MPELPEVETVRTGLNKLLPGKEVMSVDFDWPKNLPEISSSGSKSLDSGQNSSRTRQRIPDTSPRPETNSDSKSGDFDREERSQVGSRSFPNAKHDIDGFLVGAKIKEIKRRGKVLIIELSTKYSLIIHLKMTGQLIYRGKDDSFGAGHPSGSLINALPDKSTRVVFCLNSRKDDAFEASARKNRSTEECAHKVHRLSTGDSDAAIVQKHMQSVGLGPSHGQCGAHLFFNDQRKFGWVRLLPTVEVPQIDFFKKIGPEPLSEDFTKRQFRDRFKKRPNSRIKAALLDQTVVAGAGNIYADESLWCAKIHPSTLVKDLSDAKLNKLFQCLRDILQLAIDRGGSSDRNYVDAEGKKGSYLSFAKVFRREGRPCERCGTEIVKTRVAGRGTHICPRCQKL